MTAPDFFTHLDHNLIYFDDSLIEGFAREIEASYRLNTETFIPINKCMTEAQKLGYHWRSLT